MSPMRLFGEVKIGRIRDSDELKALIPSPCIEKEIVIVKPNWYSPHPGNFTDAETLRLLVETLDSKVVVVEGYSMDRHDGTMEFEVDGEKVDWRWILNNPDWDWIKNEGRWEEIKKQDDWFIDEYGFKDLFDENQIEYINVTEETWSNRNVDKRLVKETVEQCLEPVFTEKLYDYVPRRLYELRGNPIISFGKVKGIGGTYPSLTLKNLFGLVPDPLRSWWHGPSDEKLAKSIVDIAKVYASFFPICGICEAIKTVTVSNPKGEVKVQWGNYDIVRDLGIVVSGSNLVTLDAVLCGLIGVDPKKVEYLQEGESVFGKYNKSLVNEARLESFNWFPVAHNCK